MPANVMGAGAPDFKGSTGGRGWMVRWGWEGGPRKMGVSKDHLQQKEGEGDEGGKQTRVPTRPKADRACKGL